MEYYVGLDVSLKLTAICIVDRTGKIEREGVVPSDPEAIAIFIKLHAPAFRPESGRRPQPRAGSANARSDAGRAAHRGVLFSAIFLDRILVPLVDDHGVAARAQRDRVSALHEPLPILVRAPVGHDGRDAHAHQSTPSVHRTASRVAAPARRELPHRRLRAGHRFRAVARPHDRRPARLYTGR